MSLRGEYEYAKRVKRESEVKRKALEPQMAHCKILDIDVPILVEYWDYRGPYYKGKKAEIYCGRMTFCYYNNVKCKYSGISAFYPDPFAENFNDDFYREFVGEEEFKRILELRKKIKENPDIMKRAF